MRYAHNVERVLERAVAVGRAAGRADAARAADGRRAQDQHRAAAPLRRRFGGRGLPARTGPAVRGGARRRIAAPAGRARDAMGASAGGRSRARERHRNSHRPGDSLAPRKLRPSRPTSTGSPPTSRALTGDGGPALRRARHHDLTDAPADGSRRHTAAIARSRRRCFRMVGPATNRRHGQITSTGAAWISRT